MVRRLLLFIGTLLLVAMPASAQEETTGSINGNIINGVYNAAGGRPALVVGVKLDPALLGNVKEFRCRPGDRVAKNGPDGNWECLVNPPATVIPFTIIGETNWPNKVTATPFTSFNGQLPYDFDAPVEFVSSTADTPQSSESPGQVSLPPDSNQAAAPAAHAASSSGSDLNWLWGLLLGLGVVMGVGGLVLTKQRAGGLVLAADDCTGLRKACEDARAKAAEAAKRAAAAQDAARKAASDATAADAKAKQAARELDDAKKPRRSGSYAEDATTGRRVYVDDAKLVGAAGQASYQKYKDGEISAEQLQDEWNQQLGPGGLDELIARADAEHAATVGAKTKALEDARGALESARRAAADAKAAADAATNDVTAAQAAADQACKAADDCDKASVAAADAKAKVVTPPTPRTPPPTPQPKAPPQPVTPTTPTAHGGDSDRPPPGPCKDDEEWSRLDTRHFNGLPLDGKPFHITIRDESQGIVRDDQRLSFDEVFRYRFRPGGAQGDLARTYSVVLTVDVHDRMVTCQHLSICKDGVWQPEHVTRKVHDGPKRTETVYQAGTSDGGLPPNRPGLSTSTKTIQQAVNDAREAANRLADIVSDEQNFCTGD